MSEKYILTYYAFHEAFLDFYPLDIFVSLGGNLVQLMERNVLIFSDGLKDNIDFNRLLSKNTKLDKINMLINFVAESERRILTPVYNRNTMDTINNLRSVYSELINTQADDSCLPNAIWAQQNNATVIIPRKDHRSPSLEDYCIRNSINTINFLDFLREVEEKY